MGDINETLGSLTLDDVEGFDVKLPSSSAFNRVSTSSHVAPRTTGMLYRHLEPGGPKRRESSPDLSHGSFSLFGTSKMFTYDTREITTDADLSHPTTATAGTSTKSGTHHHRSRTEGSNLRSLVPEAVIPPDMRTISPPVNNHRLMTNSLNSQHAIVDSISGALNVAVLSTEGWTHASGSRSARDPPRRLHLKTPATAVDDTGLAWPARPTVTFTGDRRSPSSRHGIHSFAPLPSLKVGEPDTEGSLEGSLPGSPKESSSFDGWSMTTGRSSTLDAEPILAGSKQRTVRAVVDTLLTSAAASAPPGLAGHGGGKLKVAFMEDAGGLVELKSSSPVSPPHRTIAASMQSRHTTSPLLPTATTSSSTASATSSIDSGMWSLVQQKMAPYRSSYNMTYAPSPLDPVSHATLEAEACPLCLQTQELHGSDCIALQCSAFGCHHICHAKCIITNNVQSSLMFSHVPASSLPYENNFIDAGAAGYYGRFCITLTFLHLISNAQFLTLTVEANSYSNRSTGMEFLQVKESSAEFGASMIPVRRGRVMCRVYALSTSVASLSSAVFDSQSTFDISSPASSSSSGSLLSIVHLDPLNGNRMTIRLSPFAGDRSLSKIDAIQYEFQSIAAAPSAMPPNPSAGGHRGAYGAPSHGSSSANGGYYNYAAPQHMYTASGYSSVGVPSMGSYGMYLPTSYSPAYPYGTQPLAPSGYYGGGPGGYYPMASEGYDPRGYDPSTAYDSSGSSGGGYPSYPRGMPPSAPTSASYPPSYSSAKSPRRGGGGLPPTSDASPSRARAGSGGGSGGAGGGRGKKKGLSGKSNEANPEESFSSYTFENVRLRVTAVALTQNGSKYLQQQLKEGDPSIKEALFSSCLKDLSILIVDMFGNYFVQSLFKCCNYIQVAQMLTSLSEKLPDIACEKTGTYALQNIIADLVQHEHRKIVAESLKPRAKDLIFDAQGTHVVQRCQKLFTVDQLDFVFETLMSNCYEVATNQNGIVVLRNCMETGSPVQKAVLASEITVHALSLAQHPFGNYAVQHVLKGVAGPVASDSVFEKLIGSFAKLSLLKFSSNVVERCFLFTGEKHKTLMGELFDADALPMLLSDLFGNFVVQAALSSALPEERRPLAALVRPHLRIIEREGSLVQAKWAMMLTMLEAGEAIPLTKVRDGGRDESGIGAPPTHAPSKHRRPRGGGGHDDTHGGRHDRRR